MVNPEQRSGQPDFSSGLLASDEVHASVGTVSTGTLPPAERVEALLREAYRRYRPLGEGVVADHIPSLSQADPALFGLSICGVDGALTSSGDSDYRFSIQSISKVFVFALVCQELGHDEISRIVGVNSTGLPFNSVMAMELHDGEPRNPMVNAGALATTSLVPGDTSAAKWEFIQAGLSRFAGHPLELDIDVYESESATNQRNLAIARLLES